MANILFYVLTILSFLMLMGVQRRFSQETIANGFMDMDKGKEVAPTVFGEKGAESQQKPVSFFDIACIVATAACITAAFFAFRYSSF